MDNTIIVNRGQGQTTMSDYGDGKQTIRFADDITPSHIRITQHDSAHIILTLLDDIGTETADILTLNYAFILEDSAIQGLEFANGDIVSTADILAAAQSDEVTEVPTENLLQHTEISYEELWFGPNSENHLLNDSQDEVSNIESLEVEVSEQPEVIINDDASFVNWQLEQLVFAMASYDAPAGVGNIIQQHTKDALQSIVVASY